jgi:uncharacterized membrane-anchored protein YitT (DUF2179 family)
MKHFRIHIFNYLQAIVGTLIGALAVVIFLSPFEIAPSGVTGISVVLNAVFNFPISWMILAFNVPIVILGAYTLPGGWRTILNTIFIVIIYTSAIAIFSDTLEGFFITEDRLLNAIFGGVLTGLYAGLVYRSGMSMGGTGTIALIVQRYTGMSMSSIFLMTDTGTILLAGLVFGLEGALYALIVLFIAGLATDYVMEGPSVIRTAMIITEEPETVSRAIMDNLHRGVTLLSAKGMYTGQDRSLLYVTIARAQSHELRQIVQTADEHAFIVIGLGHTAYGGGFKTRRALSLPNQS